jgi:hypothetical protein
MASPPDRRARAHGGRARTRATEAGGWSGLGVELDSVSAIDLVLIGLGQCWRCGQGKDTLLIGRDGARPTI